MSPHDIKIFLEKMAADGATDQEKQDFLEWLKTTSAEEAETVLDQYQQMLEQKDFEEEAIDMQLVSRIESSLDRIDPPPLLQPTADRKIRNIRRLFKVAAACFLGCIFSAMLYYVFHSSENVSPEKQMAAKKNPKHIVGQPGTDKATLVLSDNSVVVLDDAVNGQVAQQGGVRVAKLGAGQLVYDVTNQNTDNNEIVYNTLTTPKGGQFKLTLPDGSKVWLNAASSIKYPTVFAGKTREVSITGEAYFEVEHDDNKPFHVLAGGVDVEDLGTSFNINAYDNESVVNTTLVEGLIKVAGGGKQQELIPGQQSLLHKTGKLELVKNADVGLAVAWKNGFTQFKSADIQSIMRQVERWYDLEVVYDGEIPDRTFTGGVARDALLSELLTILELSKIHFRIEGKRLVVTP